MKTDLQALALTVTEIFDNSGYVVLSMTSLENCLDLVTQKRHRHVMMPGVVMI